MNTYFPVPRKLVPFLRSASSVPGPVISGLPVRFFSNGDILITHESGSWIRISNGPSLTIFSFFLGGPMNREIAALFNYVTGDLFNVGYVDLIDVCSITTQEQGIFLLAKGDTFCLSKSLPPSVRVGLSQVIVDHAIDKISSTLSPEGDGKGVLREMRAAFPALKAKVKCPVHGLCVPEALSKVIIHLNDKERWTREQIADWIETLDVSINAV